MGVWKGAIVCAVLLHLSQLVRLENSPRLFQQDDLGKDFGEYEEPIATDVPHNGAENEIKTDDFADHGNPENDLTDVEHIDTEYNGQKRSSGNTPIRALHDYNKIKRSFFPKEEDVFSAYRMTRSPENTPIRVPHDNNKIKRSFFPKEEGVFSGYRMTRSPGNTPIRVPHNYNKIKRSLFPQVEDVVSAIRMTRSPENTPIRALHDYNRIKRSFRVGFGRNKRRVASNIPHRGVLMGGNIIFSPVPEKNSTVTGNPQRKYYDVNMALGDYDRYMEFMMGMGKVGNSGNRPYLITRISGSPLPQGSEKILGNEKVGTSGNGPVVSGPYFGAQYTGGGNSNPRE